MNTNVRLLNASTVPSLLAMQKERDRFGVLTSNQPYLRVLTDGDPVTLSDITNFTEKTVIGHSIEIKFGSAYFGCVYTIPLETNASEVLLELKNLKWGLMLFENGKAKFIYVFREANESQFNAIKNYPELQVVSIEDNNNVINLAQMSELTNLTNLILSRCDNLTDLTPLNGLINLTNLSLWFCRNLTDLTPLSELKNLTNLILAGFKNLTTLTLLSGLQNLTNLTLGLENLTNLTPLRGLLNLAVLRLRCCHNITDLAPLSGLLNLTHLNLERCENLTDLTPLSGLINLTNLDLSFCKNLSDLTPLGGLLNLTRLNLERCENLTDLTPLSGLKNLTTLNLKYCINLTDLTPLGGLKNLTNLNLERCENLADLTPINGLLNLMHLDLGSIENLTSVRMLKNYEKLFKVNLENCGAVRDFDELINCPQLKELKWTEKAACCYVVMGSARRRNDTAFIEEKIQEWIDAIKLTKNPEAYAKELIASVQLISDQNKAAKMLSASATELRKRGLADGDKDNALSVFIWELWAEAALQTGSENFKPCYETALSDLNAERETEVLLSPLLTTMADIRVQFPEAKEWALQFVKKILDPIAKDDQSSRLAAPAAAVFYAGMQLPEKVQYWLEKGTHPQIPRWLDNILLALVRYYSHKEDFPSSRNYLNKIKLPDLLDEGRSLLAASMAKSSPTEAVEEMALIIDLAVQTALAKQLMKEPAVITDTNGLYQLLFCLEQETLVEFLMEVQTRHPDSILVKSIASWFGEENKNVSNATGLLHLCTNPALSDFVAPRMLERFKQELQTEADQEREPLSKDLAKRFIKKGLLTEADESEFIKTFHKQ